MGHRVGDAREEPSLRRSPSARAGGPAAAAAILPAGRGDGGAFSAVGKGGSGAMTNRPMSEIIKRQEPLALSPTASVEHACRLMRERRVGAVLVVDDEQRLVGIFTGRDAVCRVLAEGSDAAATKVSEVMTRAPEV